MDNNELNTSTANQSSISLRLLWDVFKRCWYLVILGAVLMGGLSLWYFKRNFKQMYSSTSYFYISNVASTTSLYSEAQISGAQKMAEVVTALVPRSQALADKIYTVLKENAYSSTAISESDIQEMMSAAGNDANELTKLINDKIKSVTGKETKPTDFTTSENKNKLPSAQNILNMITVSHDEAVLSVQVVNADKDVAYSVAMAMEDWLPRFCDDVNNQPDAMSLTHESKTMKVIKSARKGDYANSDSDIYRYPIFITIFVAIAIYGIFLLAVIMNTTVYSAADIKAISPKYSVIGSIDHWTLDSEKKWGSRMRRRADEFGTNVDQKLILHEKVPFRIQEAFHELRTNISFCAAGEKGCSVGVASSIAGSGKSFVIANLAASLSKLYDKNVLLVDGDMRRPMIHKIFSLQNKDGLSNLLAGQKVDYKEIKHSIDRLDIITSGAIPPNPIDLLSSPRMRELMEEWKKEYDYVLFDLPPVGEVADMFAISDLISGYIFVIRSGYTDSRILRDTTEAILNRDSKIFGYVITDVHPERTEGYTKYSHYYRYSKYGHYRYYKKYENYSNYEKAVEKATEKPQKEEPKSDK